MSVKAEDIHIRMKKEANNRRFSFGLWVLPQGSVKFCAVQKEDYRERIGKTSCFFFTASGILLLRNLRYG